jgi:hypothetical protein
VLHTGRHPPYSHQCAILKNFLRDKHHSSLISHIISDIDNWLVGVLDGRSLPIEWSCVRCSNQAILENKEEVTDSDTCTNLLCDIWRHGWEPTFE